MSLIYLQQQLKAPKGQYNSFGKYNYRSCEDILEALKPHLNKSECYLTITDSILNIGDRFYVEATVKLFKNDGNILAETKAYAREEENKKGMDGSQITGSASSYARKYALNGMFLIDDTKDSDATNKHNKDEIPQPKKNKPKPNEVIQEKITASQAAEIDDLVLECGEHIDVALFMEHFKISRINDMLKIHFEQAKAMLNTRLAKIKASE